MAELQSIADIRLGASLRGQLRPSGDGVPVIQARDLGRGRRIAADQLTRMANPVGGSVPQVQSGDVLLQSRGVSHPVAIAGADASDAIPVSPLYMIRPDPETVDSEFLTVVLGAGRMQAALHAMAVGTHVPQLPRKALAELEIPLPSLPRQRQIVALAEMIDREQELLQRLIAARESLLFGLIEQFAKTPGGDATPPGEGDP